MLSRKDRMMQLGAQILTKRHQLQALRESLRDDEAEYDRLMGGGEPGDAAGERSGSTLADAVVATLDASPSTIFTAEEVKAKLGGDHKLTSIRSTLARLAGTDGGAVRRGLRRGQYQSAKRTIAFSPPAPVPTNAAEEVSTH